MGSRAAVRSAQALNERKPPVEPSPGSLHTAAAVAGFSAVQLGFEVLFIKLSRYDLGGLSLGVIGLAMFGVALAAPLARALARDPVQAAARAALCLGPLALMAGWVLFSSPFRIERPEEVPGRIALLGGTCLVVLAFATVPIYGALRRAPARAGRLYGASLLGAAAGAPAVFGLLHLVGDWASYAIVVGAAAIPSAFLPARRPVRAAAAALCLGSAVIAAFWLPQVDRAAHPDSIAIRSNALTRIDVKHIAHGRLRFDTAGINAGTSTVSGAVRRPHGDWLLANVNAAPFVERPARVLILGAGAGKNVVQALEAGAEEVVAVEINALIAEIMAERLDAAEDPYRDPAVTLRIGEGRHVVEELLRERPASFDLVYVPMVSLFGSSGQAFTQTYLMTREGFERYAGLLREGGTIAAYFAGPASTRAKVVRAARDGLAAAGVADPAAHLALLEQGAQGEGIWDQGPSFTVLARPSGPIDAHAIARRLPHARVVPPQAALEAADALVPLTDDNPYLYNDVRAPDLVFGVWGWSAAFVRGFCAAAALSLLLVLALGVGTAPRSRRVTRAGVLVAFVTMGVGYAWFQTFVLQRLGFLVGHPIGASALVLSLALLASGAGSRWSHRTAADRTAPRTRLVVTAALVAMMVAFALAPAVWMSELSTVTALRWGLAATVSAAPFVLMGTYFPLTFTRAAETDAAALPWAWALNGVGALFGSVAVVYGSMRYGFVAMGLGAALLYAGLGAWHAWWYAAPEGRRGHVAFAAGVAGLMAAALGLLALG